MSGERTERATPQRRKKAEEQGDRLYSRELVASLGTLGGVLALGFAAPRWAAAWAGTYTESLALANPSLWSEERTVETVLALRHLVVAALSPMAMVTGAVIAAALCGGLLQGSGTRGTASALQPKFSRISPAANKKRLFSTRALTRLVKSLVPSAALVWLAVGRLEQQAGMPPLSVTRLPETFHSAYTLLLDAAWISFGWSAVDFAAEWRSREQRLKMSREEMREEFRQNDGNPQIKGRIRNLRRQMRRRQLKADVRRATVVITNPTHYAVALSFDFETMDPPRLLAKGRDLIAAQIREEARWAGVPIVENPPLARSLYRAVEQGQSIPFDLYAAVAAILAYLYRQQVEEKIRAARAQAAGQQARARGGSVAAYRPARRTAKSPADVPRVGPAPLEPESLHPHQAGPQPRSANPPETS